MDKEFQDGGGKMKKMKATKEEVSIFSSILHQQSALLELLGIVKERQATLWRELEKKYKLDEKKRYTLDHKTREIKQVF